MSNSHPTKNTDIKYFRYLGTCHTTSQCPNKRVMILKDDGKIEAKGELDDVSMPPMEDTSDVEYPVDGELLVARRALSVQINKNGKVKYKNIFHIRCHVNNKVCSMIISRGSCTNVASTSFIEKLNQNFEKS